MALERQRHLPVLAHGRRVPAHRLWVWYLATDERLEVVGLTASERASFRVIIDGG